MFIRHHPMLAVGLLFAVAVAFPAAAQQAQQQTMPRGGGTMGMHGPAIQSAMQHTAGHGMPMSGDPDVDFAQMMIPHHQGAIDMARAELDHGKDLQLRQMARKIIGDQVIGDQERVIAALKDWIAQHPAKQ